VKSLLLLKRKKKSEIHGDKSKAIDEPQVQTDASAEAVIGEAKVDTERPAETTTTIEDATKIEEPAKTN